MFLQIQSVSKTFQNTTSRKSRHVPKKEPKETLQNINLDVNQGEFICIVGPSGCGKSTLLNLVAGLEHPSKGEILLNGKPIMGPGSDRVVMFQESALYPWLTVRENVMFGLNIAGHPKNQQLLISEHYLKMVELWHCRDYPIHQLSGGMKQRTALARALALNGQLLLMDEPFSALDKQTINILRAELENIWEKTGKTILYVTHSVEEAVYFADRIVVMSENPGQIRDIIPVTLPRPRNIEGSDFLALRKRILSQIQISAKKSVADEFDHSENQEVTV